MKKVIFLICVFILSLFVACGSKATVKNTPPRQQEEIYPLPTNIISELKTKPFLDKNRETILFSLKPISYEISNTNNLETLFYTNDTIYIRPIFRNPIGVLGGWDRKSKAVYTIVFIHNNKDIYMEFVRSKNWKVTRIWETFSIELTTVASTFFEYNIVQSNFMNVGMLFNENKADSVNIKLEIRNMDVGNRMMKSSDIIARGEFTIINNGRK